MDGQTAISIVLFCRLTGKSSLLKPSKTGRSGAASCSAILWSRQIDDLVAQAREAQQVKRQHRKALYTELEITGKLNGYLADLNEQAEAMLIELVKQIAALEGVTEQFKSRDQMHWVQRMNSIRDRAMEEVDNDLIYA